MAIRWRGLVAPEDMPTGDRRMFAPSALTYRSFPLFAAWQRVSGAGHNGSVAVGTWEQQYLGPGGIWGAGAFLDPAIVPEVVEAVYLLDKGIIGPSVDLDPDMTYEVMSDPNMPDENILKVKRATVHGVTFVMAPAFPQVHISVDTEDEYTLLASAGVGRLSYSDHTAFVVDSSSWRSYPIAQRDTPFDADEATGRIAEWSGGEPAKFSKAFLYYDKNKPANNRESYRLPIVDVVNGKLVLIPRAVFSAATILSGAHGGLPDVPEQEKERLRQVVTSIYDVLRDQYGDPRVRPPWTRGGRQDADDAGAASTASETFVMEGEVFAVRSSGWDSMPIGSGPWDEGEARQALNEWAGDSIEKYGRAFLWSDGSGNKTGFKLPIAMPVDGTLTIIPAAVNNAKARLSQTDIPSGDQVRIESILERIQDRMSDDDTDMSMTGDTFQTRMPGQLRDYWVSGEGAAKIRWGESGSFDRCVRQLRDEFPSDTEGLCANLHHEATGKWPSEGKDRGKHGYALISSASRWRLHPPQEWFEYTRQQGYRSLQISDEGQVSGFLAPWRACHLAVGHKCIRAPRSNTDYEFFRLGKTKTAEGNLIRTGKITIGGGHANTAYGVRAAIAHYDNTCTQVVRVNIREDDFGIWLGGGLTHNATEEMVEDLRSSPLSGDWRSVGGNLELCAVLAVNSPGFPVTDDGALIASMGTSCDHTHPAAQLDIMLADLGVDFRRETLDHLLAHFPGIDDTRCGCGV